MIPQIKIEGLDELLERLEAFRTGKSRQLLNKTMEAGLYALWESEPGYPAPPPESDYVRTGTLGRSLGTSQAGYQEGKPDIFEVREEGNWAVAEFGTQLEYAPYVIGDQQAQQNKHWWTIRTIADKAAAKIERLFQTLADEIANFIAGK